MFFLTAEVVFAGLGLSTIIVLMIVGTIISLCITFCLTFAPLFIWKWTRATASEVYDVYEVSDEILEQLKILNQNVEILVNLSLPPQPGDYPPLTPKPAYPIDEKA